MRKECGKEISCMLITHNGHLWCVISECILIWQRFLLCLGGHYGLPPPEERPLMYTGRVC